MAAVIDLRSQIAFLESKGWLTRVKREVDPYLELSAVSKKLEDGPALLFEKVKGYDIPVVIGTDNKRSRIAACLGTDDLGLLHRYQEAIANPLPPQKVADGPVKEVKITENINLQELLPIPVHYARDAGPYITTGVLIAEDPENGVRNVSYHRLQVAGPNELRICIHPRHLWKMLQDYEKRGRRTLPVAIAIGLDIGIRLAAATWGSRVPYGQDELAIAGRLRNKAVDIVRCETVDIFVPAHAEIVLEGEILIGQTATEGPFAELTGNYGTVGQRQVVRINAVTHRKNPIYQDLMPFTPEHLLLLGLPFEPTLYMSVKASVPGTKAVHITEGGCGKFHAVVSIEKQTEGDGKDAIIAGLYSIRDIKLVTVVDHDVDPFNARDVEWAVATRFQADRDLVVISGATGNELDHSCPSMGLTAKMGIDATAPLGSTGKNGAFERIKIEGVELLPLDEYLSS